MTSFFRDGEWFGALEREIDAIVRNPIEPARATDVHPAALKSASAAVYAAAGFDRHLKKPVDPRRLASALRELGIEKTGARLGEADAIGAHGPRDTTTEPG